MRDGGSSEILDVAVAMVVVVRRGRHVRPGSPTEARAKKTKAVMNPNVNGEVNWWRGYKGTVSHACFPRTSVRRVATCRRTAPASDKARASRAQVAHSRELG